MAYDNWPSGTEAVCSTSWCRNAAAGPASVVLEVRFGSEEELDEGAPVRDRL